MFPATFEVGGYRDPQVKEKQQLQMEIMCGKKAAIWKPLQNHLKRNSNVLFYLLFPFSFYFFKLSFIKFWSEWFTENQHGLTKRLQTMVSKKPWIPLFYLFLLGKLAIFFNLSKPKFLYLQSGDNIHLAKLLWELKDKLHKKFGHNGKPMTAAIFSIVPSLGTRKWKLPLVICI